MGYRLKVIVFALCGLFMMPTFAQEVDKAAKKAEKKEAVKSHLKQQFKP